MGIGEWLASLLDDLIGAGTERRPTMANDRCNYWSPIAQRFCVREGSPDEHEHWFDPSEPEFDALGAQAMLKCKQSCDRCGGDWWDGGLNPPRCPWCENERLRQEFEELKHERDSLDSMVTELLVKLERLEAREVGTVTDESS